MAQPFERRAPRDANRLARLVGSRIEPVARWEVSLHARFGAGGWVTHAPGSRLVPRRSHRWQFARTSRPLGTPFLEDADSRIGVCGDWTHGARIEDAFTSGKLLARTMPGEQMLPASHV